MRNQGSAIVLPAGGARAAYQVGALSFIAKRFPEYRPNIFCGVSAGSINACFLAQGAPFPQSTEELYQLWAHLSFDHVLKTQFRTMFRMFLRWGSDLFLSRFTKRILLRSLLDASPLAITLVNHIHFSRISRALRSGNILGLSVTATNYKEGKTTVFFDSADPIAEWHREQRLSKRTTIRVKHIMASCSIPILFEPVIVANEMYGDGSLRFSFPLSPAIKMGATNILAIGTRCPNPEPKPSKFTDLAGGNMGYLAGVLLNSLFQDSLEVDLENLHRLNHVASSQRVRQIPALLIRPSQDLGHIAKNFLDDIPFHLRQLLKSTASREQLGDLISYLMFSPNYVQEILKLGARDAEANEELLKAHFANL